MSSVAAVAAVAAAAERPGSDSGSRDSTPDFDPSAESAHFRYHRRPRRFPRHFRWSPRCGSSTRNRRIHRSRRNPAAARILKHLGLESLLLRETMVTRGLAAPRGCESRRQQDSLSLGSRNVKSERFARKIWKSILKSNILFSRPVLLLLMKCRHRYVVAAQLCITPVSLFCNC